MNVTSALLCPEAIEGYKNSPSPLSNPPLNILIIPYYKDLRPVSNESCQINHDMLTAEQRLT